MLVDANLLIYSTDTSSPHHSAAFGWVEEALNGTERLAVPWAAIGAFARVMTNPRATRAPLSPEGVREAIQRWLAARATWIPAASTRTAAIFGDLVMRHHLSANLIPDAQLAALAIEYGQVVMSADSDFARFPEIRWVNPLSR